MQLIGFLEFLIKIKNLNANLLSHLLILSCASKIDFETRRKYLTQFIEKWDSNSKNIFSVASFLRKSNMREKEKICLFFTSNLKQFIGIFRKSMWKKLMNFVENGLLSQQMMVGRICEFNVC